MTLSLNLLYPAAEPGSTQIRCRALDGVVLLLETNSFANVCIEAGVLWDIANSLLPHVLTLLGHPGWVRPRSLLHRWIVQDAIYSARAVPQSDAADHALLLAERWVLDPSEATR